MVPVGFVELNNPIGIPADTPFPQNKFPGKLGSFGKNPCLDVLTSLVVSSIKPILAAVTAASKILAVITASFAIVAA